MPMRRRQQQQEAGPESLLSLSRASGHFWKFLLFAVRDERYLLVHLNCASGDFVFECSRRA